MLFSHHSPESLKPLLLGLRVDPRADDEGEDVEKGHPCVLGEELLGERQCQWRGDPADFHDGHEAGSDGRSDLVEGSGSGNDGHGGEVDAILDRSDLCDVVVSRHMMMQDSSRLYHGWDVPQDC
jgi:hypothetical protein